MLGVGLFPRCSISRNVEHSDTDSGIFAVVLRNCIQVKTVPFPLITSARPIAEREITRCTCHVNVWRRPDLVL